MMRVQARQARTVPLLPPVALPHPRQVRVRLVRTVLVLPQVILLPLLQVRPMRTGMAQVRIRIRMQTSLRLLASMFLGPGSTAATGVSASRSAIVGIVSYRSHLYLANAITARSPFVSVKLPTL